MLASKTTARNNKSNPILVAFRDSFDEARATAAVGDYDLIDHADAALNSLAGWSATAEQIEHAHRVLTRLVRTESTVKPQKYGWFDFSHMENEPDPELFHIEIYSVGEDGYYGDEIAVIAHRLVGGKYPLDGAVANRKRERAQMIVDALNAAD